jgi:predicted nucleic acid-binding protein
LAIACIDTMILYWAIISKPSSGAEQLQPLARPLLNQLQTEGFSLVLPAIVVGQMLVPIPKNLHLQILASFQDNWLIAPFDTKAAFHYAALLQDHFNRRQESRELGLSRRELTADLMILAIALAQEAQILVTEDKGLGKIAQAYLTVRTIRDSGLQPFLF